MADFLSFPARRDVQGMKTDLGALEEGEPVHALFRTSRYGDVECVSTVHIGIAGDLLVAGRIIAGPLVADKKSGEPTRAPTSDLRLIADGIPSPRGEETAHDSLAHGDLISVDFFVHPYGEFTVSGIATEGDDGNLLVGEWMVRIGAERARAVERVRRIARDGDHTVAVPSRRGHLQSDAV
ncbi:hypothetical protein [Microbacterium karelineae]|uniref:hypothetical protein n=1 Tax=Microbacterium karelineae TaxID=2654283 RepID=UPI0012EAD6FE|nr:hypothetical protein [Microbacterium karelineae]